MIKKIVHLADIHVRLQKRFKEYYEVFNLFFEDLKRVQPDRIVIVGDIVHNKIHISPEMIEVVVDFLKGCAEICKTIIIPGNHDFLVNNTDRLDALTPLINALNSENIVYYKKRGCYVDENVVWCVYSQFEGNIPPDIHDTRIKYGKTKTYVGLFHGAIVGSKTALGFDFEDGYFTKEFEGCDFVCCGDIHLRQELRYKDIPILYCGSLIQQNFGEPVEGHGYIIWDVAAKTYQSVDIKNDYGYHTFIVGRDDVDNIIKELK